MGFETGRETWGEEKLAVECSGVGTGVVVLSAEAGGDAEEVVVTCEEVDVALHIGDAAQGLHPVGSVAVELQEWIEDGGVVKTGSVVVGRVGEVGAVHPLPFAQAAGGALQLRLRPKFHEPRSA